MLGLFYSDACPRVGAEMRLRFILDRQGRGLTLSGHGADDAITRLVRIYYRAALLEVPCHLAQL